MALGPPRDTIRPVTRVSRLFLVLALAVLAVGCGSSEPDPAQSAADVGGSVSGLVERVGVRETKILVPEDWVPEFIDTGGSGSWSYWKNPANPLEQVGVITGASFGSWLELDGVKGSVNPIRNLVSDWGDSVEIQQVNSRTFLFGPVQAPLRDADDSHLAKNFEPSEVDSDQQAEVSVSGIWIAHRADDGSCCVGFHMAWIALEDPAPDTVARFHAYIIEQTP